MTTKKTTKKPATKKPATKKASSAQKYAVRWVEPGFTQTYASNMTRALAQDVRTSIVRSMTPAQAAHVKVVAQ